MKISPYFCYVNLKQLKLIKNMEKLIYETMISNIRNYFELTKSDNKNEFYSLGDLVIMLSIATNIEESKIMADILRLN